ncbi:ERI1 exoribonuclease 3-like protein [Leptotrombidium deliense]|uniref:ERI1 exoribonuclease 3-like protein n=1 Tax=Leptotrombidium deliense TaxID=299467 RepID=A0A443S823_9ACAR|nr:ERI1 exoribonuclease 3-like protein [Leptotrombidium deliense]
MEIIEFPVLKVNSKTFQIESVFHTYIKPKINPELTIFCVKLTGILQETVDRGVDFKTALQMFENWMRNESLINESGDVKQSFAFVTFGNWDIGKMLIDQCKLSEVEVPPYMKSWINVKNSFSDTMRYWPTSLHHMMSAIQIPVVGRLHSGIDDCRNIVSAMKYLAELGHVFKITHNLNEK